MVAAFGATFPLEQLDPLARVLGKNTEPLALDVILGHGKAVLIDGAVEDEGCLELRRPVFPVGAVNEWLHRNFRTGVAIRGSVDEFDHEVHGGNERRLAGAVGSEEAGVDQQTGNLRMPGLNNVIRRVLTIDDVGGCRNHREYLLFADGPMVLHAEFYQHGSLPSFTAIPPEETREGACSLQQGISWRTSQRCGLARPRLTLLRRQVRLRSCFADSISAILGIPDSSLHAPISRTVGGQCPRERRSRSISENAAAGHESPERASRRVAAPLGGE